MQVNVTATNVLKTTAYLVLTVWFGYLIAEKVLIANWQRAKKVERYEQALRSCQAQIAQLKQKGGSKE